MSVSSLWGNFPIFLMFIGYAIETWYFKKCLSILEIKKQYILNIFLFPFQICVKL